MGCAFYYYFHKHFLSFLSLSLPLHVEGIVVGKCTDEENILSLSCFSYGATPEFEENKGGIMFVLNKCYNDIFFVLTYNNK